MENEYIRILSQQINDLKDILRGKTEEQIRYNQDHILCGIIHICLYISFLKIYKNNPQADTLLLKVYSLLTKLKYQIPNVIMNPMILGSIISLLTDRLIMYTKDLISNNYDRMILPINISPTGYLLNNIKGSILNDTERGISILLSVVIKEQLNDLGPNLLNFIRLDQNNKYAFRTIIGLIQSNGRKNQPALIEQLIEDIISGRIQQIEPAIPAAAAPIPAAIAPVPAAIAPVPAAIAPIHAAPIPAGAYEPKPVIDNDPQYAEDVVNRITCPVCYQNERDTILNCGHTLCSRCAHTPAIRKCPMCNQVITSRNRMYLQKYLKYKNKYIMLKNKNNM